MRRGSGTIAWHTTADVPLAGEGGSIRQVPYPRANVRKGKGCGADQAYRG